MPIQRMPLLLLVALVLSACEFGATPEGDTFEETSATPLTSSEPARISFAAYEYERATYEPLITAFNEQNPDVQVQFISLDEIGVGSMRGADNVLRAIVSAADTAVSFGVQPEQIAKGYVRDLAPLMPADASFDRDDYFPRALGDEGEPIYSLPHSLRLPLLSYNKQLWQASGLAEPEPGWTWAEMIAAAEQLTKRRGDEIEVYGVLDPWGDAVLGGLLAGANLRDGSADLKQPVVAQTIERVRQLIEDGVVYLPPGVETGTLNPSTFQELISQGRLALWSSDQLFIVGGQAPPDFEIGTAVYPEPVAGFVSGGQGYIMSGGSQHPEAAWRWLSFLSRQQLQQGLIGAQGIGTVPARKSLAESSGYWKRVDEASMPVIRTLLEQPMPRQQPIGQAALVELRGALMTVLRGEADVAAALEQAQASLDQQLQATPAAESGGPITVATPQLETVPDGATSISFAASEFNSTQFRELARQFNQANPDVHVEVQNMSMVSQTQGIEEIARSVDCFSWYGPPLGQEFDALLDLGPLLDADASFPRDDYMPALLAPFQKDGKLLGLPHSVSFRTLNYNPDMFQNAGIEPPSAGWTLDTFIDAAEQLSDRERKQYGFASTGSPLLDVEYFLRLAGVTKNTGSEATLAPSYTDPQVVAALRTYVDLIRTSSPHTSLQGYTNSGFSNDAMPLITNGQVGMWFGGVIQVVFSGPGLPTSRYAVAPPPMRAGSFDPSSISWMNGMFISANTQHAEACWRWLSYVSAGTSLLNPGEYPARRSVAESPAFLDNAPHGTAEVYAAYRTQLEQAPAAIEPLAPAEIDSFWFYQAIDRAIQGGDLERELAQAQEKAAEYLACVRAGTEGATCATQVDPDYNGFQGRVP